MPRARGYRLVDGQGLHLFVSPGGTKTWRWRWRKSGREQLLTLGRFPDISPAEARALRDGAREALAEGRDPADHLVAGNRMILSFEALARQWFAHAAPGWSPAHAADVLASLEHDVFPAIGGIAARAVTSTELLAAMRSVEARGCVEKARRLRQRLSAVFGYGMALELVERDPAQSLGRAMARAVPARPHAALVEVAECRALLSACQAVAVPEMTRLAHRFLALTAVRLDAVRGMRWGEIDFDSALWRVPAARMKLSRAKKGLERYDHIVPLSPQAVSVLVACADVRPSASMPTGDGLVFPGRGKNSPFGENALRDLIVAAGYSGHHVPHGWRASFSTILNEDLGPDWRGDIDLALAHAGTKGKVEGAYNRAQLLDRRRALYERWGELLAG